MLTKKFFCPVNGWDCYYWKKDGSCSMIDEGLDPVEECDDAGYFWDEEDGCPCVWEDENGNRYDVDELLEQGYRFSNGEPVRPPMLKDVWTEQEWLDMFHKAYKEGS